MKFSLFVTFLISVGFIASATGLKCYQCTYSDLDEAGLITQTKCQNGEIDDATEFLKDCPATQNAACTKSTIELKGMKTIDRNCAGAGASMGCNEVDTELGKGSLCFCEGDGCNGSSSLKVTSAILLAIPALFAKLYV